MSITKVIDDPSADWLREAPASESAITSLVASSSWELPADYLDFLRLSNGGEGELGIQPCWFCMWRAEEVIAFATDYQVADYAPGFFAFGTNGGSELLAFDCRSSPPWPVVALPSIGLEPDEAMPVSANFGDFAQQMGRSYKE
ncbi:MAG: SMI1/KNR4 family protein [Prosthecobacter sp.]|uniref:SMI1/KNR4 family protein n=1 Tax=Prosthecobacter sp. TaxID=1965333 RepID=UPI0025CBC030|nr:SMI1/KNR4 family protein [Prosthecobacter sp.]MCF7787889.1 SMI1/KNR4 family protein [Prosthecobacter sp.]